MVLCLALLRLPGHQHTGGRQQAVHHLVTQTARQAVNVGLDIITLKTHDDDRFALEARVLTELPGNVARQFRVDPVLQ